jgi:hypothetical protein
VALTSLATKAWPQCVVNDDPAVQFTQSNVVFLGTVSSTESTGAQGDHVIVQVATLRVDRSWKGNRTDEVRVGADRPFEKGKQYLVFASGTPLTTSILCRWAQRVEDAKPKLDWLLKNRLANTPLQPTAPR